MSENVWVVGVSMMKFGRYPDKDTVDLGSQAALDALDDAGLSIHDMGVMGVGCLYEANAMLGQRIQKQIGQTGIPVYNVANACATGATALRTVITTIKAGEADAGLAIGVEQMGKMGLLGGAGRGRSDKHVYQPAGRYGAVMGTEGVLGTNLMPGVFAQAGMEYAYKHDGVGFEQFAKVAEKNHWHSQHNPLAQYQKVFSLEEVMGAPPGSGLTPPEAVDAGRRIAPQSKAGASMFIFSNSPSDRRWRQARSMAGLIGDSRVSVQ
jgi:acetyl-CoA acetyltransferase